MTPAFQPGEYVQLTSGGPGMTAEDYDPLFGVYYCEWFDASGRRHIEQFAEAVLKRYTPPPAPPMPVRPPVLIRAPGAQSVPASRPSA